MRRGEVAVSVATVIARVARAGNPLSGYASPEIAAAVAEGQRVYYEIMEAKGRLRLVGDSAALASHVQDWGGVGRSALGVGPDEVESPERGGQARRQGPETVLRSPTTERRTPNAERFPLGIILSMEGADPILSPEHVAGWWKWGLRAIGPAHYGVSSYAHGTTTPGGLLPRGPALLEAMEACGMILDVTHLADDSFWQALEVFGGTVLASHSNCRALVPGDRQLSDDQIRALVERGAVIGAALDAWMLYPGWVKGETSNSVVSLEAYVDQIDHVCQLAGDTRHAAIGTDLDGGYGTEQCPHDLDTIADLQKVPGILRRRGYSESDVEAIMHGNWLRLFAQAWSSE
jgi:membrane dipeptidase